ncbi:MAG: alpha/beta hydrolase [Solirubrobacterales bacterium]|nr:alpha/beta hydrolase [Solirubrobacterales bacterium]
MPFAGKTATWRTTLLVLAVFIAAFVVAETPARSADPYTVESDIAYGPANDQPGSNLLDVYVPVEESPSPRPVFVWIHGGGWFTGDKVSSTMPFKAKTLVDAGFVFVSVNYRLSPELDGPLALSRNRLRFPTHYLDAARAIGWVDRNIADFGGNPNRMLIGGDSAGGQISTLLATRPAYLKVRGVETRQIRGIFSLDSVGFDVPRMMTRDYRRINAGFQKMMFNAFGTPAEEKKDPSWASASPIRFADRSDPPIFFVVPTTSPDRWVDARKMSLKLGQRLSLVSHRVRTEHAGVVPLLGNPSGDMGVTKPLMRFADAAINPVRYVPVVRGSRVTSATGRSKTGVIRLRIGSAPAARLVTCRINGGRETLCRRSWRLRIGPHKLRVSTYGGTGRVSVSLLINLKVSR